jgi:phosphatidylglycerol:prolipoprotein diacylglycerol transferase
MLAVAALVCAFLLQKEFARNQLPGELVFDFVFWVVMSGIIGCRIFYVLLNLSFFVEYPVEIVMIHHGGLAWQGGVVTGIAAALIFIRVKKLPVLKTLDLVAPYIALGQSIGRAGCFLNGCCYGKSLSWGIYFPVHQAHLHPTQLYDSLGLLILFFVLKGFGPRKKFDGEVFILYLIAASFLRFMVEFFRADHTLIWGSLSVFQIMTLCFMSIALYAYLHFKSRRRQ